MKLSLTGKRMIFITLFASVIVSLSCQSSDKIATGFSKIYWYDLSKPFNSSIVINNGEASTHSKTLKVRFSARDNIGIVGYYLSDQATTPEITSSGWIHITPAAAMSVNKKYYLRQTESLNQKQLTLFVWFKDAAGNVSKKSRADIAFLL
ncbi:MAG: hypothetical protein HOD92_01995 [Deltaproteobacteria bacterium]|jgi:hypothetical protein|nr:hypothetical protein [Deltaproteobacteria bacterium]MBT4526978.1 hypothetical protein [Deltaproteobacteria bacterium]